MLIIAKHEVVDLQKSTDAVEPRPTAVISVNEAQPQRVRAAPCRIGRFDRIDNLVTGMNGFP